MYMYWLKCTQMLAATDCRCKSSVTYMSNVIFELYTVIYSITLGFGSVLSSSRKIMYNLLCI